MLAASHLRDADGRRNEDAGALDPNQNEEGHRLIGLFCKFAHFARLEMQYFSRSNCPGVRRSLTISAVQPSGTANQDQREGLAWFGCSDPQLFSRTGQTSAVTSIIASSLPNDSAIQRFNAVTGHWVRKVV
jgi:hypothetical protein